MDLISSKIVSMSQIHFRVPPTGAQVHSRARDIHITTLSICILALRAGGPVGTSLNQSGPVGTSRDQSEPVGTWNRVSAKLVEL